MGWLDEKVESLKAVELLPATDTSTVSSDDSLPVGALVDVKQAESLPAENVDVNSSIQNNGELVIAFAVDDKLKPYTRQVKFEVYRSDSSDEVVPVITTDLDCLALYRGDIDVIAHLGTMEDGRLTFRAHHPVLSQFARRYDFAVESKKTKKVVAVRGYYIDVVDVAAVMNAEMIRSALEGTLAMPLSIIITEDQQGPRSMSAMDDWATSKICCKICGQKYIIMQAPGEKIDMMIPALSYLPPCRSRHDRDPTLKEQRCMFDVVTGATS